MSYQFNKAIHPGVSVSAALEHLGMTQKNLSDRTELNEKTISQIVNGEASITAETAIKFENVLGGSASFWMNLETNYKTTVLRIEQSEKASGEIGLASMFPYAELCKRGYVEKTTNPIEKVLNLWRFFAVNSLATVPSLEVAAYRRGLVEENELKKGALAAWLRCGEIQAAKGLTADLVEYDRAGLRELLPKIRNMTSMKEQDFFEKVRIMLASVGVGLVAIEYFPGTKASGATRWIGQNPIIQLSTFGKDADKVWFTLFHEIGHILLHGRKDQFISFTDKSKTKEEIEADDFAAEKLISATDFRRFTSNPLCVFENTIREFAEEQGIDPGIVVGRMKNEGIIDYRAHSKMHTKLRMYR